MQQWFADLGQQVHAKLCVWRMDVVSVDFEVAALSVSSMGMHMNIIDSVQTFITIVIAPHHHHDELVIMSFIITQRA